MSEENGTKIESFHGFFNNPIYSPSTIDFIVPL